MIQIDSYARKKKTGTSSSSNVLTGGGFASTKVEVGDVQGVNIWGQYHDHTGDIDGDLTSSGTITGANINGTNVTASGTLTGATGSITGNLVVTGNVTAGNATLTGDLTATNGTFSGDISCDDIDCDDIGSKDIITETITVTKQAHFFNLTIDEIKSVGGQVILSAANATIDQVIEVGGDYELSWRKTDGSDGIDNMFKVGDQVICQTFNKTDATGENVTNKYYWSLVTSMGETYLVFDGVEYECYYITISGTYFDGSSVPEAGDKICQLGYRGNDDDARQSAIILSAYQSPDPNVTAPSIVQYAGINSFSLEGCIVNQMSPSQNLFTGEFKVVNNGTTTDVIDLIQGQNPQVIVDSEQAWIMADSNSKTYYSTDYQNLPVTIKAYLGSTVIPYSEWTTGSKIKYKNQTFNLTGTAPSISPPQHGLGIDNITRNTNDVTLSWIYTPNTVINTETQETTNNGTTESNSTLEITIVFTHSGTTYTITKNVPFNMIKASAVTQGADAELDKLMVDKLDLTVTLDNKLTCKVDAKVFHIQGSQITQVTSLTDYSANLLLSNGDTVSLSKSTYFYKTSNISNSYSSMTNPPTSATLRLYKNGTLLDEVPTSIKFDSGSIFTITDNAITSAVSQANTYTNTQISTVTQTANSISSRVTAIENDYITSSELTQTANEIQLNVYDELNNKTGIDVTNGKITLNGNTDVNGTLSLSDEGQGFLLQGAGYTQISPQSIGTYSDFRGRLHTVIDKYLTDEEIGTSDGSSNFTYSFSCTYSLGVLGSGKSITITPWSAHYYNSNGSEISSSNVTESNKTYVIKEDGVQKATGTYNGSFLYTTAGGNITVTINVSASIPDSYITDEDNPIVVIGNKTRFAIPYDGYMLIGYDGLAINFNTTSTAYIGAEGTTFYYNGKGLRISDSGIQKYNGTNWVGIDQLNVKIYSSSDSNVTLGDTDEFLIFTGAGTNYLTLGTGHRKGRKIYVKDRGSGIVAIGGGGDIYAQNSNSPSASISINNTMIFLIWDGSAWNLGYCG